MLRARRWDEDVIETERGRIRCEGMLVTSAPDQRLLQESVVIRHDDKRTCIYLRDEANMSEGNE